MEKCSFEKAKPIWIEGKSKEMNVFAEFYFHFIKDKHKEYKMMVTGSTLYEVYVNGTFVGYGPARAPHGYARVDEYCINQYVKQGENAVKFIVAGTYCASYYTIKLASFLQAELLENDTVICQTNRDTEVFENTEHLQKTARYSFQRTFTESYHMGKPHLKCKAEELDLPLKYLTREVPYPKYDIRGINKVIQTGEFKVQQNDKLKKFKHIFNVGGDIEGFQVDELDELPYVEVCNMQFIPKEIDGFKEGNYAIYDVGLNDNGFILSNICAEEDSEILLIFDEKLMDNQINIAKWSSTNVIKYSLKKGNYQLKTFETVGFRYLQVIIVSGKISSLNLSLMEYCYPNCYQANITCDDTDLKLIFEAARETFRQNTIDVFMDCPTRERAGWLCDSYFTAQSAKLFADECSVEKVMLENIVLAKEIPHIPDDMIPMCYPADHINGNFIPQWAMWFIIQLEQYLKRDNQADKYFFQDRCNRLLNYLKDYENEDGLLERLPKWNFIEWSQANDWVMDVNYPTNMLYSKCLKIYGELFDETDKVEKSDKIKAKIIAQSFNGKLFYDHAIRINGKLQIQNEHISEVCQYYAVFFDIVDFSQKEYTYLKDTILNVFGPERKAKNIMPEIAYANAFIGNFLRMEILMRLKLYPQLLEEVKGYFLYMAKRTGTLWEHDNVSGSLNHGFASFVAVVIKKCLENI